MILTLIYYFCCVCLYMFSVRVLFLSPFLNIHFSTKAKEEEKFSKSDPFGNVIYDIRKREKGMGDGIELIMWNPRKAAQVLLHHVRYTMWDIEPSDQKMQCPVFFRKEKLYMPYFKCNVPLHAVWYFILMSSNEYFLSFFMEKRLTYQNRNIIFSN